MKSRSIILLLITTVFLSFSPVQGQVSSDAIDIDATFNPEPVFSQMIFGENYYFEVVISNLNLDLKEGDIVHTVLNTKFSGDLVVHVSFTVSKEGAIFVGTERQEYIIPLLGWEKSNQIILPSVGGYDILPYSFNAGLLGYGEEVDIDEWVTFNIDINVYLWQYMEIDGEIVYLLSDYPIGEAHLKFYIISNNKMAYVNSVFRALNDEIEAAQDAMSVIKEDLGTEINVSLSDYETVYDTMNSLIESGNYFSALAIYDSYKPRWRNDIIVEMYSAIVSLEGQMSELTTRNEEIETDKQALIVEKEDLVTQLAQIEILDSELKKIKSYNRLYIFGIVALGVVLLIVLVRMYKLIR
jgi:hypothetical protein